MPQMTNDERKDFYLSKLDEHRHLIKTALARMEAGDLTQALTIAMSIRTLVHETGKSTPLLKHLRPSYLDLQILDSKDHPRHDENGHERHPLMRFPSGIKVSHSEPQLSLNTIINTATWALRSLGAWWRRESLLFPETGWMSRKEVILGLANHEGAHVDADMPAKYRKLITSRIIEMVVNDVSVGPLNIARFIAGTSGVQLLDCLDRYFPKA